MKDYYTREQRRVGSERRTIEEWSVDGRKVRNQRRAERRAYVVRELERRARPIVAADFNLGSSTP